MTLDEQIDKDITPNNQDESCIQYGGKEYSSLKQLHKDKKVGMTICNFSPKYRRFLTHKHKGHALAIAISLTTKCPKVRAEADDIISGYDRIEKGLATKWI